jgi:diacylglycerol kinase family enzyme
MPADFFHLLNPNRIHRDKVTRYFNARPRGSYGWVERTCHPTHLETLVEWAVREGHTKIALWGGDGTFGRAVQALEKLGALSRVEVGLVPVGTCNDFARRGVSSGLVDIGLIEANGLRRVFMNNAGFGRSEGARTRKPNPIKDIFDFSNRSISVNGRPMNVFLGMVCNAPYFSGGLHFATDVSPTDGVLNSFFVSPQNKAKLLFKFARARHGHALLDEKTVRLDGTEFLVEASEPFLVQSDGEWAFGHSVTRAQFSLLDNKLRYVAANDLRRRYDTDFRR